MKKRLFLLAFASLVLFQVSLIAQPTITSFAPSSGVIGTSVIITGTNFSSTPANNIVYFGAVKTTVTAAATTSLTVTVPAGATYQPITVTTGGLTAYSSRPFIVTFSTGNSFSSTSFDTSLDFTTLSYPLNVSSGDLDGDGKAELVVTNYGSGSGTSISVFRNTSSSGNISLAAKVDFVTPAAPMGIRLTDIDGDGKLDMVVSINSEGISVFRNTSSVGALSFASRFDISSVHSCSGGAIGSIFASDVDGDGKTDIVMPCGPLLSVVRNTSTVGSISFASAVTINTSDNNYDVAVGDLDGDGKPDMAVALYGLNLLSTYRNTSTPGNLSFAAKVDFGTGVNPGKISLSDFDGDGKTDVAVTNFGATTTSLFKNSSSVGTISMTSQSDYTSQFTPWGSAAGDIDGDGKPDLALATGGVLGSLARNTSTVGTISFAAEFQLTTYDTYMPLLTDLDNDGKQELIIAAGTQNKLKVFRNKVNEPIVSSFAPTSAGAGATVTITGSNFTGATAVTFGGVAATFNVVSPTSITATVPSNSSGSVSVTNPSGTNAKSGFTFIPAPTVSSFTPTSAATGNSITITGTNFTGATSVSIGGLSITSFAISSSTTITATIDVAATGSVSVTTPGGTGSLAGFTFLPGPKITAFSPLSGAVGSSVTITGTNFSATAANNIVYFGAVRAVVTAATTTSLTAKVPSGATYQPISVTTGNLTAFSSKPFDVTFTGIALASNSFVQSLSFQTGTDPKRPVIADLDNDGKPEIVFANSTSNSISIVPNTGGSGLMSLNSKIDIATTSAPAEAGVGDFDGDGKIDIAACINGTLSVFKNTTTSGISFSAKTNIAYIGVYSTVTMIVRDLDGDGRPEIILPTNGSAVSIFRNITVGSTIAFAAKLDVPVTGAPADFAIGDIDGDGMPDLAAAIWGSNVLSILRNTSTLGTISFATKTDYPCGSSPFNLLFADLNNDGQLDIAAPNYGASGTYSVVSIFKNTSTIGLISFAPKVDVSRAGYARIFCGDMDGDGKADIVDGNGQIHHNATTTGSISFDPLITYNAISSNELALGDMDGNGKPDIVALNSSDGKVFRNQINEPIITSFSPKIGGPGTLVTINGFNLDLALVSFGGISATTVSTTATQIKAVVGAGASGQVKVVTGNGVGVASGFSFFTGPVISSFTPVSGITGSTVTINGSGFGSTPANNIVRFGTTLAQVTSANAFQLVVKVPGGATVAPITVTAGNLTGYSTETFSATSSKQTTLTNGTFAKNDVSVASNPQAIATGDFDDDGKPDLAVVNGTNLVSVFSNTSSVGNTSLGVGIDLTTGSIPVDLVTGDFNLDGKLDIAVANSSTYTVSVFNNTSTSGAISFAAKVDFTVATNPQSISVGDLNGDARPDIVTSNFTGSNLVSVLLNTSPGNGSTSFAAKSDFTAGSFPTDVAIADLDNDANAEMIVTNGNANSVTIFKNTISGGILSFQPKTEIPSGTFPVSVVAGEINGDNWMDFVVANNSSSTITVFKNTGDGTLNFYKSTYTTANGPWAVAFGEMNGDSNPDINVACSSSNVVSVLRNVSGNFSTKIDYAVGGGTHGLVAIDIDGDGTTDMATVNNTDNSISLLRNNLPSLISFTPTSAGPGTTVTITGINLANVSAISFGGSAATSYNSVSATSITAVVPSNATSGNVTVTNSAGSVSLQGFVFIPKPVITSFTPLSAGPGATVTITGTNLNGATSVSFGGTPAVSFNVVSATSITALVGSGTSGVVSVTTPGGTATLVGFTFVPQPTVTSFNPSVGGPGVPIIIIGTNFTGTTAVSFGGVAASSFTVLSATSIKAAVAIGASGDISIITPGGIGTISGFTYDVTVTAIEPMSSIEELVVEIFPNPTHGSEINFKLHKSWEGKLARLAITDISGRVAYANMITCQSANTVSVMHGELKLGMYILMLQSDQMSARAKLIVVE